MKYMLGLSSLIFLLHFTAAGQDFQEEIGSLLDQQAEAWNQGNIDRFMQTYWQSDQLQFLNIEGPTHGWTSTLENYYRRYPDRQAMGHLTFGIRDLVRHSKKSCTLIGTYHLERSGMENKEGFFLLVLQKIKRRWQIVADSTH